MKKKNIKIMALSLFTIFLLVASIVASSFSVFATDGESVPDSVAEITSENINSAVEEETSAIQGEEISSSQGSSSDEESLSSSAQEESLSTEDEGVPVPAMGLEALEETINLGSPDTSNANYTVAGSVITLTNPDVAYIFQGSTTQYTVVMENGFFNVTLNNASIKPTTASAILAKGSGTTLNLNVVGTNALDASGVSYVLDVACSGLQLADGASLVIDGSGKLTAKSGVYGAAIGAGHKTGDAGSITINNATVEANGYTGSGIGGGNGVSAGDILIDNAKVTATTKQGAGIGGGYASAVKSITIQNNSNINSTGGNNEGAGIGAGTNGSVTADKIKTTGDILIKNSTITAMAAKNSAAIGGGPYSPCGNITIIDCPSVFASANLDSMNSGGAGIGGGGDKSSSVKDITIINSDVVATAGIKLGAGIGAGYNAPLNSISIVGSKSCGNITITGGNIKATGGGTNGGAGIGGGYYGAGCGNITITNAVVTAKVSETSGGAGIGGGNFNSGTGDITISGGTIYASGNTPNTDGGGSAGIGGGGYYKSTTFEAPSSTGQVRIINNADVTAIGGNTASAIGNGHKSSDGISTVAGLFIDDTVKLRAYARNAEAITSAKVGVGGNPANIINAYISNNAVDTFKPYSNTKDTYIITSPLTENVKLPAKYTSFAYNAPAGEFTHSIIDVSEHWWLVKLDDTKEVQTETNFASTALKLETRYYTVTFDARGGEPQQDPIELKYGEHIPEPVEPTASGKTFLGWSMVENSNHFWYFDTQTIVGDTTLYAIYQADEYNVYFDAQGGSPQPSMQVVESGGLVDEPLSPSMEHYQFLGWNTSGDASGDFWDFNNSRVSSELTLYAIYEPIQYTVTFDSNGGTPVNSQTALFGQKITEPVNPEKANYVFTGWYTESNLSVLWNFANDTIERDVTLYAGYVPVKYTLTFESNGGSSVASQQVPFGSRAVKPSQPSRGGFVFAGWYKESGLTTPWNFDTDTMAGNTTLYAKWSQAATYTVTFNSQGGSAVSPISNVASGSTIAAPTQPTRSGFTFGGWYKESGLTNQWNFTTDRVGGNITLYARWSAVSPSSSSTPASSSSSIPGSSSSSAPSSSSSAAPSSSSSAVPSSSSNSTPASTSNSGTDTTPETTPANNNQTLSQQRESVREELIEAGVPTVQLGNTEVPLFGLGEKFVWSLVSLLLMLSGVIAALVMSVKMLVDSRNNQYLTKEKNKKSKILKLVSAAVSLVSFILFFLLYDLNSVMVFIDMKTIVFALLFGAEITTIILSKKKDRKGYTAK